MERRSFLKGLLGTAAVVAIPTTIVKAQRLSENTTLNNLYKSYYKNIITAVEFNDVTIVDKPLASKVNKALSLIPYEDIINYTDYDDFSAWVSVEITNVQYFNLINRPYDAHRKISYIQKVLRYHTKHNKTVWWYKYSYPYPLENWLNDEIKNTKKKLGIFLK